MLLTTTGLANVEFEVLGLVTGSKVKATHLGRDILAMLKNLVGGEVKEYSELLKSVRSEAIKEMVEEAKKMGANGIIGIRFASTQVASGMAEIIVYGTAVKI
ncbi:MAG: YbjQ family protein [Firmicutes bacterium]|jgi:uncharacterized protein YbjQ (UPF0145 family)|nr:YbjQ family protein [Bacillota bacterium]